MPIKTDARIRFGQSIQLKGPSAIVSVEIFGGPIAAVQVAVFDSQDKVLEGVGFGNFGEPLTTEADGSANWLFKPVAQAAYVKWGVLALRSAAGLGNYSVTGKVRDQNGDTVVEGRFNGAIPDGALNDKLVFDGVKLTTVAMADVTAGAQA
jgi:hypothetical protein